MMRNTINFHIEYRTIFGQSIGVKIKQVKDNLLVENTFAGQTDDGINWTINAQVTEHVPIEYKYIIQSTDENIGEFGEFRKLLVARSKKNISVYDQWRPIEDESNAYFSAAFKDIIYRRTEKSTLSLDENNPKAIQLYLKLNVSALAADEKIVILGNNQHLGYWQKVVELSDTNFPVWETLIELSPNETHFEYKYGIVKENKTDIEWEFGENRVFNLPENSNVKTIIVKTDESFRFNRERFKGAGVAIPVFSLRSKTGLGIGEFCDIKKLVDWASICNLKMVQVLPVNDTIATKTWVDSYPYAAISVFALHPLYVNIQAIGTPKDKKAQALLNQGLIDLNNSETVDFEGVMKIKFELFSILFQEQKISFFKNKAFLAYFEENKIWLKSYSAFCYLRDKTQTVNFENWKENKKYSDTLIDKICDTKFEDFDKVALYYFIQFHAHTQLLEATNYARTKGVILKGDLPIGIYRYSCDAWVAPHLYNMEGQAGAPPDDYAEAGQNWGFPTYNWEVMANDNFDWWKNRMISLSTYYDALRIDHILGFFRIWEIPTQQIEGTLGLFNPRLPFQKWELENFGLHCDLSRFTAPYITENRLQILFGDQAEFVKNEFLESENGILKLKTNVDTQVKIRDLFQKTNFKKYKNLEKSLIKLVGEILLITEIIDGQTVYNPRITLFTTSSYKELDYHNQQIIKQLYDNYFFQRHNDYWEKQAYSKLPALLNATNMLICGEDLGMIPKSVPGVMKALNIVSLEIQRMPKGQTEFGNTETYPYFSVCSPSCHDMSTVRGWWENDAATTQRFYNNNMRWYGEAPRSCSPFVVETIVNQHLYSPSMWAVFPIQDLVGIDGRLRKADAKSEQINEPSNPQHYWRFRFHIPIEDLLSEHDFNQKLKYMISDSKR